MSDSKMADGEATTDFQRRDRNSRLLRNVLGGVLARVLVSGLALVTVPLTIRLLGTEHYGVFVTITAVVNWVQFGLLGLGKGLLNALVGCYSRGDVEGARKYIASAWVGFLAALVPLGMLALVLVPTVQWTVVFGSPRGMTDATLEKAVAATLVTTLLTLAATPCSAILSSFQEERLNGTWSAIRSVAALMALLATLALHGDIVLLSLSLAVSSALVLFAYLVWLFGYRHPELRPTISDVSWIHLRQVVLPSAQFFLVDICAIGIYQTDRFFVLRYAGAEEVASYDIALRFFALGYALFTIVTGPLWPSMGDALNRKDFHWLRRSLNVISGGAVFAMTLVTAALALLGDTLTTLLTRRPISPGTAIWLLLGVYFIMRVWTDVHSIALYSLGRLRPLLAAAALHAVFSIGASLLLGPRFGALGIATSSVLSLGLTVAWIIPLRVRRHFAALGA